jgi:glycosyltransferase involved in cell wall biosynthesis
VECRTLRECREHEINALPGFAAYGWQIAVVIPALNEEQSISRVLREIPRNLAQLVLVVDNGSSDHTASIAQANGAAVVREPNRGYGAACLAGIKAVPDGVQIFVFLDADYSDYPQEMEKLVAPIRDGKADLVIGSRMIYAEAKAALTPQQRWGNWLATSLIRILFRRRFSDLGPFRAISKQALEKLQMSDRNYGWTVEMQIKAIRAGLRIIEVPVRYRRRVGQSKISGTLNGTMRAGAKILYTIFRHAVANGEQGD